MSLANRVQLGGVMELAMKRKLLSTALFFAACGGAATEEAFPETSYASEMTDEKDGDDKEETVDPPAKRSHFDKRPSTLGVRKLPDAIVQMIVTGYLSAQDLAPLAQTHRALWDLVQATNMTDPSAKPFELNVAELSNQDPKVVFGKLSLLRRARVHLNLTGLSDPDAFLTKLTALDEMAYGTIVGITLSGQTLNLEKGWKALEKLAPRLETLSLNQINLTDAQLRLFSQSKNLKEVSLSENTELTQHRQAQPFHAAARG
jgi:hypothetical protein